jgi:hypothetical protein
MLQPAVATADITPTLFHRYTCLADLPEPDLFIRTGGEQRISNFLLWQWPIPNCISADRLWPDYDADDLEMRLRRLCQSAAAVWSDGEQVARNRTMLKQRIITASRSGSDPGHWAVLKLPVAGFGVALLAVILPGAWEWAQSGGNGSAP